MKKRILSFVLLSFLIASLSLQFVSCESNVPSQTLYVYNWGEYISDGSEGSLDVNTAFEEYCADVLGIKVTVNYSTFSSNESMYAKVSQIVHLQQLHLQ